MKLALVLSIALFAAVTLSLNFEQSETATTAADNQEASDKSHLQALHRSIEYPSRHPQGDLNRDAWLRQHTREALARQFFEILERL